MYQNTIPYDEILGFKTTIKISPFCILVSIMVLWSGKRYGKRGRSFIQVWIFQIFPILGNVTYLDLLKLLCVFFIISLKFHCVSDIWISALYRTFKNDWEHKLLSKLKIDSLILVNRCKETCLYSVFIKINHHRLTCICLVVFYWFGFF